MKLLIRMRVTGGTFPDRIRICWAVLRFLLATRHLTEYQVGVLFDRVVTETELMDLDVTVRRSVR